MAVRPCRPEELAHFVANPTASASSLTLEAGNGIPCLAQFLEAFQEGLDPLRRYLDDVVHGCAPVMLRYLVRPDDTRQPARKEQRVKTRSGASDDLGGPGGGRGRWEARSFDAPRRAGRVANQGSTAARKAGRAPMSSKIRRVGKRPEGKERHGVEKFHMPRR